MAKKIKLLSKEDSEKDAIKQRDRLAGIVVEARKQSVKKLGKDRAMNYYIGYERKGSVRNGWFYTVWLYEEK